MKYRVECQNAVELTLLEGKIEHVTHQGGDSTLKVLLSGLFIKLVDTVR